MTDDNTIKRSTATLPTANKKKTYVYYSIILYQYNNRCIPPPQAKMRYSHTHGHPIPGTTYTTKYIALLEP